MDDKMQRTGDPHWCRLLVGRGTVGTAKVVLNDLDAGTLTEMATSQSLTVSSGSANDTAAGTGARTITVRGLDADWNLVSEQVTLNGQTAVALNVVKLHPFVAIINTAGSGGTNAGIIYVGYGAVTSGVPANTVLAIATNGFNQSRLGFMPVPKGYQCVIEDFGALTAGNVAGKVYGEFKPFGGLYLTGFCFEFATGDSPQSPYKLLTPAFPEKTLIRITGIANSSTMIEQGHMNLKFYKNNI